MPRLPVTVQRVNRDGVEVTYAAPQASGSGGNSFVNDGHTFLRVIADGTAATNTNVTIETPLIVDGQPVDNKVVVVPKSHNREIGPFPVGDATYNQVGNVIWFDCSATITGLTIAVVSH